MQQANAGYMDANPTANTQASHTHWQYIRLHIYNVRMQLDPTALLYALVDPTRLRVVHLLVQAGERCVCELVLALDSHQPKISRHLKVLRDAGLIQSRRNGTWMYYRMNPELPTWGTNALQHLLDGCSGRQPYINDLERLASADMEACCS